MHRAALALFISLMGVAGCASDPQTLSQPGRANVPTPLGGGNPTNAQMIMLPNGTLGWQITCDGSVKICEQRAAALCQGTFEIVEQSSSSETRMIGMVGTGIPVFASITSYVISVACHEPAHNPKSDNGTGDGNSEADSKSNTGMGTFARPQ